MKASWQVWYGVHESNVCGRDPDTEVFLWSLIICTIGIVLSFAFQFWLLLFGFIVLGIGVVTGARYCLAVTRDGYRLTRYCCWCIPWFSRSFDQQAVITIEDDWDVSVGFRIRALHESYDHGIVFGTGQDCETIARRIGALGSIHHGIAR